MITIKLDPEPIKKLNDWLSPENLRAATARLELSKAVEAKLHNGMVLNSLRYHMSAGWSKP